METRNKLQATLTIGGKQGRSGEAETTPVSPLLFGSFIEHIENCIDGGIVGNEIGRISGRRQIREDVRDVCKELSPSILRFPGGTVMGIYHWEDYVGPMEQRKKIKNIVWGGMMTREFGTTEFVRYARRIGAEPMICVNMPTGTPEEAAHWVEYCNGTEDTYYANLRRAHGYDEPFRVKYWCIGNESFAESDLGLQSDPAVYIREAWEYAKYMKMTDPEIELVFVGNGQDEAWNRAVLDSLSVVCDYLSIHFYAGGEDPVSQSRAFESGDLARAEALLDEYNARDTKIDRWYRIPGRSHKIQLALDEWNIWNPAETPESHYGLAQKYSFADALWTADFLMMMIRHADHIGIANLAQMVNVIAPIMAEEQGVWKQTTFYPFAMFGKYCGDTLAESELEIGHIRERADSMMSISDTGDLQAETDAGAPADSPAPGTVSHVLTLQGGKAVLFLVNRDSRALNLKLPFEASETVLITCEAEVATGAVDGANSNVTKAEDGTASLADDDIVLYVVNSLTQDHVKVTHVEGLTEIPAYSIAIVRE